MFIQFAFPSPRTVLAAAALALLSSAACSQAPSAPSSSVATASSALESTYQEKLVGTWQFVYDDARRGAVEAELASTIKDPAALLAAKKEAEDEARDSTVAFTKDHDYVILISGKEFRRLHAGLEGGPRPETLLLTSDEPKVSIPVTLEADGTITMRDPHRGDLHFARAPQ